MFWYKFSFIMLFLAGMIWSAWFGSNQRKLDVGESGWRTMMAYSVGALVGLFLGFITSPPLLSSVIK